MPNTWYPVQGSTDAKLSGCWVRFADNQYDHGPVIPQKAVLLLDDDNPDTLVARVFEAECEMCGK